MFTAQSHLFPFPLYLPPICIWRLKSQQKLFSMWVFFSCHCPSSALLSVCDAHTHRHTCSDTVSRSFSSYLLYLHKSVLEITAQGGTMSLSMFAFEGECLPDSYSTNHCQTSETQLANHDCHQTLKPPSAQLHLNWDAPNISKWSHSDLEKGFNWDTSRNPSQPMKLDHHNSHTCLFPPSSRGRKEWQNRIQRKDSIESGGYPNTIMVLNYTTFNHICQKNRRGKESQQLI